jgi:hypothetical protein
MLRIAHSLSCRLLAGVSGQRSLVWQSSHRDLSVDKSTSPSVLLIIELPNRLFTEHCPIAV